MSSCFVQIKRKQHLKKYLDENQYPYDESDFELFSLSNNGFFYTGNTILSCGLLGYVKYYMEDFIVEDFISSEEDLISFLKEI